VVVAKLDYDWYHKDCKLFKELGLVSNVSWHSVFFETGIFLSMIEARKPRILICGSADEETLSIVHKSLEKNKIRAEIVVVDACEFPLKLVEEYAKSNGVKVELVNCDAMSLPFDDSYFDLVMTDAFLDWFENPKKKRVIDEWWRVLGKNGLVLTSSRIEWKAEQRNIALMIRALLRRNPINSLKSLLRFNERRICHPLNDVENMQALFENFCGWAVIPSNQSDEYAYIIARK